ncbi:MAG: 16S rRNA (uracil(1498)-N(3))-methyltransferase [Bacteroidia bacterium]|nr:16S rRNA (uracil(1498)-N(3))-methyltransferase [Bacteroidia bacterium]
MIVFYQPDATAAVLDAEESRHCVKVLRKKNGDTITITDGKGVFYDAVITDANADKCRFKIDAQRVMTPRPWHITIAIAPTKSTDRLEWFIEKAVEIGVDKIILTICDHSERTHQKADRLHKVAVSAMKQSLNPWLPGIDGPMPFNQVIQHNHSDERFIAHLDEDEPRQLMRAASPRKSYIVMIGPEGDFSGPELELAAAHNYRKVSLGASRLRTETAGMVACHILTLINFDANL